MAAIDIPRSFGALLIGGLFASLLSGFIVIQVFVYFKLYPKDHRRLKSLVLIVWLLDTCHTLLIWLSLWRYFIDDYGNSDDINNISPYLALSVLIPAILTLSVHMFFAHRIFMLSRRNFFLTMPIVALAILRLGFVLCMPAYPVSASATTTYMLKFRTFSSFRQDVRWIFTTGLALSTAVDILITGSLCILLQTSRTGMESSNAVIDSLITYTFETGALTCAGTIASMLCWLIIPNNLIFMGLHFVIGKLYANSLLVTLNTRESTRLFISLTLKEIDSAILMDSCFRVDVQSRKANRWKSLSRKVSSTADGLEDSYGDMQMLFIPSRNEQTHGVIS